MLEKDAILSKISMIQNCLRSIQRVTEGKPEKLDDVFVQDVFVLNLQRACQAAIDMASLVISLRGFQLPNSYKQSFQILAREAVITPDLATKMGKMAGFRNIAVHDYRQLEPEILKSILRERLGDLEEFSRAIYTFVAADE